MDQDCYGVLCFIYLYCYNYPPFVRPMSSDSHAAYINLPTNDFFSNEYKLRTSSPSVISRPGKKKIEYFIILFER